MAQSTQFNRSKATMPAMETASTLATSLAIAPMQVLRGWHCLPVAAARIKTLGNRPLVVGGNRSFEVIESAGNPWRESSGLDWQRVNYQPDCSENSLATLHRAIAEHHADVVVGVGGGKALDAAKLLGHQCQLPVVTIPTSAATCAAWTALSNIYSDAGAFQYDVALARCPELLILDYALIQTAPLRTLVAGIGDAIAKWYEASVSSGHSIATLTIAAVQQARVLRDILLQKSVAALEQPGGEDWQEVVDATVMLAGVIGGLGGANCRTVAAHAIHNGLTHLLETGKILHGEKVAYGILVQLRLEEMVQGKQLAASARHQLLKFYQKIGLPMTLADLGLSTVSLEQLQRVAEVACQPDSDIHRLPFPVFSEQVLSAMVSTTLPVTINAEKNV